MPRNHAVPQVRDARPGRARGCRLLALLLAGVGLVAVLVHGPALAGGFVWDDQALIVNNQSIRSWEHLGDILSRDFFHLHDDPAPYGYYRPVVTLSYLLDYQLWGLEPAGFHLTNVLVHAANSVLVALLLLRLGCSRGLGLAVALLFAVHPIHTENVAWIAGRTDLIAFLFTATALLLYLEGGARGEPRSVLTALSWLAFGLGLLAKEMSVVLLAWLPLVQRLVLRLSWRDVARGLLPYVLLFVGYCGWRLALDLAPPSTPANHGFALALLSAAPTVVRYLGWMALPVDLTAYVQNPYTQSLADPRFLGAVALLALLGLAVRRFLRGPPGWLWVGMLAAAFVPLLNLARIAGPADMGNVMAERFAYFPSFPFLAAACLFLVRLAKLRARALAPRVACAVALAGSSALGAVGTCERIRDWRDEHAFLTRALAQSPTAPLLWGLRARWHLQRAFGAEFIGPEMNWREMRPDRGELAQVAEAYRTVVELDPADAGARHNLGAALHRLGDNAGAVAAFRAALRIDPDYVKARINLGAALQDRGEVGPAIEQYREALRILERDGGPARSSRLQDHAAAQFNLGRALVARADPEGALAAFREALGIRPDLTGAALDAIGRLRGENEAAPGTLLELQPAHVLARARAPAAGESP